MVRPVTLMQEAAGSMAGLGGGSHRVPRQVEDRIVVVGLVRAARFRVKVISDVFLARSCLPPYYLLTLERR